VFHAFSICIQYEVFPRLEISCRVITSISNYVLSTIEQLLMISDFVLSTIFFFVLFLLKFCFVWSIIDTVKNTGNLRIRLMNQKYLMVIYKRG
jgi:hypothetical protein